MASKEDIHHFLDTPSHKSYVTQALSNSANTSAQSPLAGDCERNDETMGWHMGDVTTKKDRRIPAAYPLRPPSTPSPLFGERELKHEASGRPSDDVTKKKDAYRHSAYPPTPLSRECERNNGAIGWHSDDGRKEGRHMSDAYPPSPGTPSPVSRECERSHGSTGWHSSDDGKKEERCISDASPSPSTPCSFLGERHLKHGTIIGWPSDDVTKRDPYRRSASAVPSPLLRARERHYGTIGWHLDDVREEDRRISKTICSTQGSDGKDENNGAEVTRNGSKKDYGAEVTGNESEDAGGMVCSIMDRVHALQDALHDEIARSGYLREQLDRQKLNFVLETTKLKNAHRATERAQLMAWKHETASLAEQVEKEKLRSAYLRAQLWEEVKANPHPVSTNRQGSLLCEDREEHTGWLDSFFQEEQWLAFRRETRNSDHLSSADEGVQAESQHNHYA